MSLYDIEDLARAVDLLEEETNRDWIDYYKREIEWARVHHFGWTKEQMAGQIESYRLRQRYLKTEPFTPEQSVTQEGPAWVKEKVSERVF